MARKCFVVTVKGDQNNDSGVLWFDEDNYPNTKEGVLETGKPIKTEDPCVGLRLTTKPTRNGYRRVWKVSIVKRKHTNHDYPVVVDKYERQKA